MKKKLHPIAKFFLTLLFILLGLIIAIGAWCGFSALNKKDPLSLIPSGYSVYLHTDSFYDAVNPLLDLQAADIFLADDEMSDIRGIFMMFRESEIRNNKYVKFLASTKIDAALYSAEETSGTYIACVNLGLLSSVSRLANIIVPKLNIEGISTIQAHGTSYFQYENGSTQLFFKPIKNLVLITNNLDCLFKAESEDHSTKYSPEAYELLTKKTDNPIKLVLDTKQLIKDFTKDNPLIQNLAELISDETLSLLSFGITDNEINLKIEVPVSEDESVKNNAQLKMLTKLLEKDSTFPELPAIMSSSIQYYTVLNIAPLEELKNVAFPLLPENMNGESLWKTGNDLTKSFFKVTLDELLFSWTDKEYAVLGIEGLNDPVIAIKISNETKRKEIFDSVFNSFILNENKSLILNGVRIPRLELPPFLQNILNLFNFSIPKPYYLVYNNYLYLSQSAESISAIYSTFSKGRNISFNENWKAVSEKLENSNSISLFYDLERSRPFFINSTGSISKILELYSIGRADISVKNKNLIFALDAVGRRAGSLRTVPGFPIELKSSHNSEVSACEVQKPSTIFWLEDGRRLKAMNVKKTQIFTFDLPSDSIIQVTHTGQDEFVMALTDRNDLYMFNEKLEIYKGYPVSIEGITEEKPFLSYNGCYIPSSDGYFHKVKYRRHEKIDFKIDDLEDKNLVSFYDGNRGAIYEKGFLGKIYYLENGKCLNPTEPVFIEKIGFGLPALTDVKDKKYYGGFISQSGELTIHEIENESVSYKYTIQLDGIFYSNVEASDRYFYALSEDAELFRIDCTDGSVLSVKIDNSTAKEGKLKVHNVNGHYIITAGIDGNLIYAFNDNLELVSGFPIAGIGIPAFADVNGDNYPDCFALTIDKKLNAWNLR